MSVAKRTWVFAVTYMGLSMLVEIILLVIFRLKIPQDNAIIAPVLLIVSPILAALGSGYRRPREFSLLVPLTVILTLLFVLIFGRLTGISTGLLAPVVIRTLAGFLAATITNRAVPPSTPPGNG